MSEHFILDNHPDYYSLEDHQDHCRTSCSDSNMANADPDGSGCVRCNVLFFNRAIALQKKYDMTQARLHELQDEVAALKADAEIDRERMGE